MACSTALSRVLLLAFLVAICACEKEDRSVSGSSEGGEQSSRGAAASAGADPSKPALVILGDSLTAGYGLGAEQAMPALLQKHLDEAGKSFKVINAGRSGDTAAGGASRIAWYLRDEVGIAALVIFLGANDAMRGLGIEQLEENLLAIVQAAREYRSDLPVFLVQVRAFPNLGADYRARFEAVYPRVAETAGIALLPFPLQEVAGVPALNQEDGIHPNAEGTEKVSLALWEALREHL